MASERERLIGNLHFVAVAWSAMLTSFPAIQLAALIVHAGVGSCRIVTENSIEQNQRLDDDLPVCLFDFQKAADELLDAVRRQTDRASKIAAALRDLFEQRQSHCGDEHPELDQFEHRNFLKGLNVGAKAGSLNL